MSQDAGEQGGEGAGGAPVQKLRLEMKMDKYEIIIYWSDEDGVYIADVPELPGCMAHGSTQAAALKNAQDAIGLWIDTAMEFNDPIPVPKGRRLVFA